MKKSLAFLLVFVLLVSFAFSQKVTLTMTHWGNDLDVKVYQERADLVMKAFPNIDLKVIYIPGDYDQKLQTMIAGGTAPDIILVAENVNAYSATGQLASLDEFIKKFSMDLNLYPKGLLEQYSYKGKHYAIPDRSGAMIVYFNKDYFDKAGLSYPTKDWTWKEFLNAAQKLTVRSGDKVEVYGFAAGDWWPWWMSFMYQNGGRILDANGKPVVNSKENVEAMQFYNDLVYKYKVAPSPRDYGNLGTNSPDPLFARGLVAIEITGFWNISSLMNVPELNWDIAPVWKNKEGATVAFGSGLAITNACKNKEEAFKVVQFLTSVEGQTPIVKYRQDVPSNYNLLNSKEFSNFEVNGKKISMNTFAQSSDIIMKLPIIPQWNEMMKVFGDYFAQLFMNEISAKQALDSIQDELEFILE